MSATFTTVTVTARIPDVTHAPAGAHSIAKVTNGPCGARDRGRCSRAMATTLACIAAGLVGLWGVAHAIPTRQVVAGFAPITPDNRRVILQEWLAEAITMWGIAALIFAAAIVGPDSEVTIWVYRILAGLLIALAVLTGLTGARTPVIWFKICPVLLTSSAVLLLVASVV